MTEVQPDSLCNVISSLNRNRFPSSVMLVRDAKGVVMSEESLAALLVTLDAGGL